jgi:GT2 family glycosyltransferase
MQRAIHEALSLQTCLDCCPLMSTELSGAPANAGHTTPPGSPSVAVIILNWNGRDDTFACLESLEAIECPNFTVMVVDNGSEDSSVDAISRRFSDLEIIETGRNLGFAEGNNVGIRIALERGADYVFLLNNDTIVHALLLRQLIEAAERCPEGAVFGVKIYFHSEPERIWYAGVVWDPRIMDFRHLEDDASSPPDSRGVVATPYVCGCAFLARSSMLRKVGLLDPKLFLVFEDTDLCFRARDAGFCCYYVPSATLWHKMSVSFGGPTSPLAYYFVIRNRLLWGERHLKRRDVLRLYGTVWRQLMPPLNWRASGGPLRRLYRFFRELHGRCGDPVYQAMAWGALHYLIRRFGDAPQRVPVLAARARRLT